MSNKICEVEECEKIVFSRGWCNKHYARWYRSNTTNICKIEGCEGTVVGYGWCQMHYVRWKIHGDPNYKKTLRDRFELGFTKRIDGCWIWNKSTKEGRYGQISVGRKMERVHRVSWNLYFGEIPSGMYVLHKCDNPLCVNPAHLFIGTQKDNMDDMIEKGREPNLRGERNGRSKLVENDVRGIRKLLLIGERQKDIAIKFGVSLNIVSYIATGKTWGHVK